MFPNPQDALPVLRERRLGEYDTFASVLVEHIRTGEDDRLARSVDTWVAPLGPAMLAASPSTGAVLDRLAGEVEAFARRRLAERCDLADARHVVARSHGFATWEVLAAHVVRHAGGSDGFEAAADAVVTGDEGTLSRLLAENPRLADMRSDREHGAPLLVYTSANGVENFRQRTPENAVAIASVLLDAGADVDATAHVYGAACTTLGLVATSGHPRDAGVQLGLLDLLLARGATMEDEPAVGTGGVVLACLGNACPEAADHLARRGARIGLAEAAGLGHLDTVRRFLGDGATTDQIDQALLLACAYGHTGVADLLLSRGADLATTTGDGQTPAHQAVIAGRLPVLTMLLAHDPPLEQRNAYGGTVLGQALWSAGHADDPDAYLPIIDALLAAGATLDRLHVPVGGRVDDHLAERGSRSEPTWYWFGEEPRSDAAPRRPP